MAEYTAIRISRETKERIEEMKPDGVAWHVVIDYLFKSYLARGPPESWVKDLFVEQHILDKDADHDTESWVDDLFTGTPEEEE
jgi:hypothetical protein